MSGLHRPVVLWGQFSWDLTRHKEATTGTRARAKCLKLGLSTKRSPSRGGMRDHLFNMLQYTDYLPSDEANK